MSQRATNPNIARITRSIDRVQEYYEAGEIYRAWDRMLREIEMIGSHNKVKHKSLYIPLKNSLEYALKRISSIRALNYPDAYSKASILFRQLDNDFIGKFTDLLWACNLLSDGGYSFYDTTDGKDMGDDSEPILEHSERDVSKII